MSRKLQIVISAFTIGILYSAATSPLLGRPGAPLWPENPATNVPICQASNNQDHLTETTDGAGGAIIAWEDHRPGDTLTSIYAQHIDATGRILWTTDGIKVCEVGTSQKFPSCITDGTGGAIIVWTDNYVGGAHVVAQRLNSNGECLWSTSGVQLTGSLNPRWFPSMCSDGKGGMIVAWYESRPDSDIAIVAQSLDSFGNLMWGTDGVLVCDLPNGQVNPQVVSDGKEGAIIQWTDLRDGVVQIYCQRFNGIGQALWQPNGISICPSSDHQYAPSIISSRDGGAFIVWHDFRILGEDPDSFVSDILAQRIDSSGAFLWNQSGLPVCTAAGYQYRPTLALDTSGGIFISWYDYRNSQFSDIYAQHVAPDGQFIWTTDGILVCGAPNHQQRPLLLEDGLNGIFVAWEDERNGIDKNLYWQHVKDNGSMDLSADGVLITTGLNDQYNAQIVGTSAGGAIIVWQDGRIPSNDDIYADRILLNNPQATAGIWIGAQSQYGQAVPLYIGMSPTAMNGLDPTDIQLSSIPSGNLPSLWSELKDEMPIPILRQNVRQDEYNLNAKAQRWFVNYDIGSGSSSTHLLFTADRIPSGLNTIVYDLDSNTIQKIDPIQGFSIPSNPGGSVRHLQVLTGDTVKPSIEVTYPYGGLSFLTGDTTIIRWNISDSSGILRQYIYLTPAPGQPSVLIDSVDGSQNTYTWIPGQLCFVAQIYILAFDSVLNSAIDTSDGHFMVLAGDSVSTILYNSWNLVSVPLQQNDMSINAVFRDDFGSLGVSIFEYDPVSSKYYEPTAIQIGMGYWLYSFSSTQVVDVIGTPIINLSKPMPQGWNIIGAPFPISFHVNNIIVRKNTEEKSYLAAVSAGWVDGAFFGYNGKAYYAEIDRLEPWLGYWFLVNSPNITFDYDITLAKSATPAETTTEPDRIIAWSASIDASLKAGTRTVYDQIATFGSAEKATSKLDYGFDLHRPPHIPDSLFIEVSFLAQEAENQKLDVAQLAQDIRSSGNNSWPMVVTASHPGLVTLTWNAAKLQAVDGLHSCMLVDAGSGARVDMLEQSSYSYSQSENQKEFEIRASNTMSAQSMPTEFALCQNFPNPFNPTTQIRFSLAEACNVRLQIFDILGREIKMLAAGQYQRGSYTLTLDASTMPSGVYMYRLQAGNYTAVRKLVLLK